MNYWQSRFSLGNLSFPRFIGGPLDGITDSPFRQLIRHFSTDELLYTEMRHVGTIAHDPLGRALKFKSIERPLSFQIAANSVGPISIACEKIMQVGVDIIDLNVGCPAKNVVRSGSGSALMADPVKLKAILQTLRAAVSIPITIKIRAGFKEVNAVDIALLAQDCGADALAIHPRLQTQFFTGQPDYALAAQVKKALSIPVLLSGNVVNWATARAAYEATGVDGFLIGRALWARPWKLAELAAHSQANTWEQSQALSISMALQHLDGLIAYYGDQGLYHFRKHLSFYVRGATHAKQVRSQAIQSESVDQVRSMLSSLIG